MRLVITRCHRCKKITGAMHADTLEELENIGAFIREKKRLHQELSVLDYNHSDDPLHWCNCIEELTEGSVQSSYVHDN